MATQTEARSIAPFHRIDLRDYGVLNITVSDHAGLSVTADAELLPRIETSVSNNTLRLSVNRDWIQKLVSLVRVSGDRRINYDLTMSSSDLHSIRTSGAATVQASTVETDSFDAHINGYGKITVNTLTTQKLEIKIAGRGEFRATGTADQQSVSISGSGEYHGRQLTGTRGDIRISGQGNAILNVSEKLDINIAGAGKVDYIGMPTVSQNLAGAGKVNQIDA